MPRDRALPCPKCATLIDVAPLAVPLVDAASGEVTGAVFKRCPRCQTWSWMTPEAQRTG
jgi:phage FluMu protein Com